MVAPVLAGSAGADSNSSAYPVAVPAGTADGDLLIGVVCSDWGTDAGNAFPAGWTKLTTSSFSAGTNAWHNALYARVAASEPASYSIAHDASDSVAAICRITGWDSASGIAGAVKQVAPRTTGTGKECPSIVPFGADDLLFCVFGAETSIGGARTWNPPAGMTEVIDRQSGIWASMLIAVLANPANPSGVKTATPSAAVDTGAGSAIAIKAAGGGGASLTLGLVTETDSTHALTRQKSQVFGQPTETDSAFSLTRSKALALGQPLEADSAPSLSRSKSRTFGVATETNSTHPLVPAKAHPLGLVAEDESALTMSAAKGLALGLPITIETALALSATKTRLLGLITEFDSVFALNLTGGASLVLGLITETDSVFPIGRAKVGGFGLVSETDLAQAIGRSKSLVLGEPLEVDTTFALSFAKELVLGLIAETDTALALDLGVAPDEPVLKVWRNGVEVSVPLANVKVWRNGQLVAATDLDVVDNG